MKTRPIYPFSAIVGQEKMKLALILNVINPGLSGVLIRERKEPPNPRRSEPWRTFFRRSNSFPKTPSAFRRKPKWTLSERSAAS